MRGEVSTGVYFKPESKEKRLSPVGLALMTVGCRGVEGPWSRCPLCFCVCVCDIFRVTERKRSHLTLLLKAQREDFTKALKQPPISPTSPVPPKKARSLKG